MTLATPAFVDLPEDHLKKEAIAKFSQGCFDKDAAKHACFEHPSTTEEALNLVKHHQYISQAVDGKKSRRGNDIAINSVQPTSEARIEQIIASALKQFATKFQVNPKSEPESPSKTEDSSGELRRRPGIQCFFCKKFGHFKKDCKIAKMKMNPKAEDLNEKGQDGRTTRPAPKK